MMSVSSMNMAKIEQTYRNSLQYRNLALEKYLPETSRHGRKAVDIGEV